MDLLRLRPVALALASLALACTFDHPSEGGGSSTSNGTAADGGGSGGSSGGSGAAGSTGGTVDVDTATTDLMARLPGLWIAPVSSWTSAGSFPVMNIDIRPADDTVMFGRVDLDASNSLRFAFAKETQDGAPTLVFRNGGLFKGLSRDSRSILVEADTNAGTYRFCALMGGCGYIDARFTFDAEDHFDLAVDVMGMKHMKWSPSRVETRDVPAGFPSPDPQAGDSPFPPMPTLKVTVSMPTPPTKDAPVWVVLSTTDCSLVPGSCNPSREISGIAKAGAGNLDLVLDQIHAGTYRMTAVLDRNADFAGTLFPDTGDGVSVPNQMVEVKPTGTTSVTATIAVNL